MTQGCGCCGRSVNCKNNLSVSLRSTRPGCGSQHLRRFACILLAAAPTALPCFRHWRRSLLLPLPRGASGEEAKRHEMPKPLLLGEVAAPKVQTSFLLIPSREKRLQKRPQAFLKPNYKNKIQLNMPSNDDDRRQWRKQGGVVGAAASKTQVPPKARSGCWVPQPDS